MKLSKHKSVRSLSNKRMKREVSRDRARLAACLCFDASDLWRKERRKQWHYTHLKRPRRQPSFPSAEQLS